MHPRIVELLDHIERERGNLEQAVDCVPAEQRSESPTPDRWSVAGVLEHLAILEARIAGLIRARVAEARAAGVGPETETSSILATANLGAMLDRSFRISAPAAVQPSGMDADAAWTALEAARLQLRNAVVDADGLALAGVIHPHPALGPLNLYQWIAFTGSHTARHAAQIREIGEQLAAARSTASGLA